MFRGLLLAATVLLYASFAHTAAADDTHNVCPDIDIVHGDIDLAVRALKVEAFALPELDVVLLSPANELVYAVELDELHDQVALQAVREHRLGHRPPHERRRPQPV